MKNIQEVNIKDTVMSDERFIELFTEEQKRQGVPDKYNFPEAIAGNVHYHRMLAQAQAKLTIKRIVEWGNEPCDKHNILPFLAQLGGGTRTRKGMKRRRCPKCWRELEEGASN